MGMVGSRTPDWDSFAATFHSGDIVDGCVTKLLPFGAFVEVAHGVVGLLTGDERPEVGSLVPVRIHEVDTVRQRVSLRAA
jgi:ribosomal protein S1